MTLFAKTPILIKLTAAIIVFSLLSAVLVSVTSFDKSKASLSKELNYKLQAVNDAKSHEMEMLVHFIEGDVDTMSKNPAVLNAVEGFSQAWSNLGKTASVQLQAQYSPNVSGFNLENSRTIDRAKQAYAQTHEQYHSYLSAKMKDVGYGNIYLFDTSGNLVYSVKKQADYATNFFDGPWAGTNLGQAYRNAIDARTSEIFFYDFEAYGANENNPASFVSTPILDQTGTVKGVVAVELLPDMISSIFENVSGLGETGEVYVVGSDNLSRSTLKGANGKAILSTKVATLAVKEAFSGKKGVAVATDYRDNETIVSYNQVDVFDTKWAVIAQENTAEAFAPIQTLKKQILLELGLLALVMAGLGYLVARSIAKPVKALTTSMSKVVLGDTETDIPYQNRGDEIGEMSKSLAQFRDNLGEAAIANRTSLFKGSAFDWSSMPMMIIDRDFIVTFVNDGTKKLFKDYGTEFSEVFPSFNPENIIGTCIDVFHKAPSHQRQLLSDPKNLPFDADISVGDLKFHLSVSGVFDRSGEYQGNVLQWDNVTAIRKNSALIKAINGAQAVIEFDITGEVVDANENFLNATGYSLDEIKGQHHKLFVKASYAQSPEYRTFWERLASGEAITDKFERVNKAGEPLWLDASYSSISNESGKPYKVVKIATDITASELAFVAQKQREEKSNAAQEKVVSELANGLRSLSQGDLISRIDSPFTGEYEMLRNDFNAAVDKLNTTINRVSTSVENIQSGANEMSQSSDDLSERTENQAAALEETAAALDEVTATVKETAKAAEEARSVVTSARSDAESGGHVVRDTVDAMDSIKDSSDKISQIIGVIDEIAFQTNLLALNAGVEAARAGEAGRGFAVVASEVRALAQRSSDAAKDIKGLISASAEHVQKGVKLVDQTGTALDAIVDQVANIDSLVSDIAASANEQATGLAEVNNAVNDMDRVTQKNAAMVEESTAACHALTNESDELSRLVAHFDIGKTSGFHNTPIAPSAPSAPSPVHEQQGRAAAFFASNQGSTALAVHVDDEDDWQDF